MELIIFTIFAIICQLAEYSKKRKKLKANTEKKGKRNIEKAKKLQDKKREVKNNNNLTKEQKEKRLLP